MNGRDVGTALEGTFSIELVDLKVLAREIRHENDDILSMLQVNSVIVMSLVKHVIRRLHQPHTYPKHNVTERQKH